jgi:hypothetical protein
MKIRMGATHFLMKTLPKVAAEMALHVLEERRCTRTLVPAGLDEESSVADAKRDGATSDQTFACPSQYVMPISRYIAVAMVRCSCACPRLPARR